MSICNYVNNNIIEVSLEEYREHLIDKYESYKPLGNLKICYSKNYCAIADKFVENGKVKLALLPGSLIRSDGFRGDIPRKENINNIRPIKLVTKANIKDMYMAVSTITGGLSYINKLVTSQVADQRYFWGRSVIKDKNTLEYAEKSGESNKTDSEKHAESAHNLSEEGIIQLENRIIKKYKEEKQREKEESLKYTYEPYCEENQAFDLHSDSCIQKLEESIHKVGRVILTGSSGVGKTALAQYYVAKKFGYKLGTNTMTYKNALLINGRASSTLIGNRENPGALIRFIKHIKDNNIKGPYVVIYNEAQNGIDSELEELWDMWNKPTWYGKFQTHYGEIVELPKDMYWIFTACSEDENILDKQVINRLSGQLGTIEIGYISNSDLSWVYKLITNLSKHYSVDKNTIDVLVTSIAKINDSDRGQVISLGNLLNVLENKDIKFITDNIPKELMNNSSVKKEIKTMSGVML